MCSRRRKPARSVFPPSNPPWKIEGKRVVNRAPPPSRRRAGLSLEPNLLKELPDWRPGCPCPQRGVQAPGSLQQVKRSPPERLERSLRICCRRPPRTTQLVPEAGL